MLAEVLLHDMGQTVAVAQALLELLELLLSIALRRNFFNNNNFVITRAEVLIIIIGAEVLVIIVADRGIAILVVFVKLAGQPSERGRIVVGAGSFDTDLHLMRV